MLDDQGLFWWSDTTVPLDQFAPDDAVAGKLTISATGQIKLELNGVLPNAKGRYAVMDQGNVDSRSISGALHNENRQVLLKDLYRNGGSWRSNGLSSEVFVALYCLVSTQPISPRHRIRAIEFDLSGYEEWLALGKLKIKRTSRSFKLSQLAKPDLHFREAIGSLIVKRHPHLEQKGLFGSGGTTLREQARFLYTPSKTMDVEQTIRVFGAVQDLLVLLTDSEFQMAPPTVGMTKGQKAKLYFGRSKSTEAPPEFRKAVVTFPAIQSEFGSIFFSWLKAREELGAGAYLYLATRRGLDIYQEHKFLNLMTGLEAYHRTRIGDGDSTQYEAKVGRLLAQIEIGKDRSWLKKRLKSLGGPSLEERLLTLLQDVPIPLDQTSFRQLLTVCAKARNDIAHQGKSSDAEASGQPLHWLSVRNEIVSRLYHARLLLETGVESAIIARWLSTTSLLDFYLERAGLKPRQAPTPSPPATAPPARS